MVSAEEVVTSPPTNFIRGERGVSASVRLRQSSKKEEATKKKRNRHSGGDFASLFTSSKSAELSNDDDSSNDDEGDLKDWSYITFPNGGGKGGDGTPDVLHNKDKMEKGPKMTPVKVVTREVPGLLPLRPLSTLIANVPGPASSGPGSKRLSGDFSGFRRKSEIFPVRDCRDEFEFTTKAPLVEEEVSDDEQQDKAKMLQAKIAAGLGRRSVTSVNLHCNKKKNSYRSALCKSQENLVKATALNSLESSVSDLEDVDKDKSTLKKGLLWQQRDKLFSRWKERYFVLTRDYLHCFKRRTSRITEMGEFIFKIKLGDVEDVELLDKRGYLTICISLPREGKVYLRKTEGIREWYALLKECARECRKKRRESSALFKKQNTDSTSIEKWIQDRKKIGLQYSYSDSTPEISKIAPSSPRVTSSERRLEITLEELNHLYKNEEEEEEQRLIRKNLRPEAAATPQPLKFSSPQEIKKRIGLKSNSSPSSGETKRINRLSLMSDIELPDCCNTDLGIDLEKGIFLRKKYHLTPGDAESNDSGNNSMNTNGSVGSTTSSSGSGSSNRSEERLETHFENMDKVRDRSSEALKNRESKARRRSSSSHAHVVPGLQITHV